MNGDDAPQVIGLTLRELEYIIGVLGAHNPSEDDHARFPRDEMEDLYEYLFVQYTQAVLDQND